MNLRKRQRDEPHLPFAGLQNLDDDVVSLAIYGIPATLHPLQHSATDVEDEDTELVPWGPIPEEEGSADPILVDRFDCRLLLDPSELREAKNFVNKKRLNTTTAAATAAADAALETELDEERWRDLYHSIRDAHYNSLSSPSEEEEEGRQEETPHHNKQYAAIPFTYTAPTTATITGTTTTPPVANYLAAALHAPPPPPPLATTYESFLLLLDDLRESDRSIVPFSATELAVMQQTAAFLQECGEEGARLLRDRAEHDVVFAFVRPEHSWCDFFQGLVSRQQPHAQSPVDVGNHHENVKSGALGLLVGQYASSSDGDDDDGGDDAEVK